MKAGFGLVGLLITIGVVVWLLSSIILPHDKAAIDAGRKASETVNQIAGNSADGSMRFGDSLQIDLVRKGGKIDYIVVLDVKPGGPADTYYGLKKDDCIIEFGPLTIRDQISSKDEARDFLTDSYQRMQPLVVIRYEKKITLPLAPAPGKPPTNSPEQQIDSIQKSLGGK